MLSNSFDYLNPPQSAILMYAQHLANIYSNVTTIKNYISGAKSLVRNNARDTNPFDTYLLANLIKGIARLSTHVPSRPLTLTASDVRRVADALAALGPSGVVARAALLFGVATFLRQSNFVVGPASTAAHLLTRGDLTFTPTGLNVTIRSTKTIWDARDAVVIPVAAAPGSPYCPVAACRSAVSLAPASPDSPIFLWPGGRHPLTAPQLTGMLKTVLRRLGHPAWSRLTLHSLRHTGATLALGHGATLPEIMDHGTWRSKAVHTYIPRLVQSSVPSRIADLLANGPKD